MVSSPLVCSHGCANAASLKKKILNLNMYYFTDNIEIKKYKETTSLKLGKEKRNTIEHTLQMLYFIYLHQQE